MEYQIKFLIANNSGFNSQLIAYKKISIITINNMFFILIILYLFFIRYQYKYFFQ